MRLALEDLRRLGPSWLVWTALIVADDVLLVRAARDVLAGVWSGVAEVGLPLTNLLVIALTWLLASALAVADSPVRSTAAWRTRPIARGDLAAAKLGLSFLMLALLPAGGDAAAAMAVGLPAATAARTAAVTVLNQSVVLSLALAFGSLRPDSARAFLAGIGAALGTYVLSVGLAYYPAIVLEAEWMPRLAIVSASASFIALMLAAALSAALFVHQVLTWQSGRSTALAAGATVLVAASLLAPWDLSGGPRRDAAGMPVSSALTARLESTLRVETPRSASAWCYSFVHVDGLPADVVADPVRVRSVVRAGSAAITSSRRGPLLPVAGPPQHATESAGLPDARLSGPLAALLAPLGASPEWTAVVEGPAQLAPPVAVLPARILNPGRTTDATIDVEIDLRLCRFAITGEAPLDRGATIVGEGRRLVVSRVERRGPVSGPSVLLTYGSVQLARHDDSLPLDWPRLAVVDHDRRFVAIKALGRTGSRRVLRHFLPLVPHVSLTLRAESLAMPPVAPGASGTGWLRGVRLVALGRVQVGTARATVSQPVVIPAPPDRLGTWNWEEGR